MLSTIVGAAGLLGTAVDVIGGAVGGTVIKKAAGALLGGGSGSTARQTTSGPSVVSSEGFMTPITDSGNITSAIIGADRGVKTAQIAGQDIKLASVEEQGTDPISLANRVRQLLEDNKVHG